MNIIVSDFGSINGKKASLYTLRNKNGMSVDLSDFGATVVSIKTADKEGNFDDVVIGYSDASGYLTGTASHGATVGRYANRIKAGCFELNGEKYQLALNDNGVNHLHGGNVGYNKRFWDVTGKGEGGDSWIEFSYTDPDGEESYPGKVEVSVKFTLTEGGSLKIMYRAVSDKDTIVNLTNHSYFNLSGYNSGEIYDHMVKINAEQYTPTDGQLIPTGQAASVKGTMLDFTDFRRLGDGLAAMPEEMKFANGYDHNFILGDPGEMRSAATVTDPKSGRIMEVITDMPAIQLYTGNFLDGTETGKDGKPIKLHAGLCLETQFSPNSPNLEGFPSCTLKAGAEYNYTTIYSFKTI